MKSLFILSLPRSLSTEVHRLSCEALGLKAPGWTSAGEILNLDRSTLTLSNSVQCRKYLLPSEPGMFRPALEFLGHAVEPDDFAYKDVIQPFVAAQWLAENPGVAVLKIVPNLSHVAFSMIKQGWLYPSVAATSGHDLTSRLMSGLIRAEAALAAVPGESVSYESLLSGFEPLRAALVRLYPDQDLGILDPGPSFEASRDAVMRRRQLDTYRRLQDAETMLRAA